VTERGGMAKTELQNRCSTTELTRRTSDLAMGGGVVCYLFATIRPGNGLD
jgi:hypothetical protein